MRKSLVLILVLVFLTVSRIATPLPVKAESKTIVVPDDYATISLALQNVRTGDTVFVKKGTYHEEAININKSISLIGESVDETILSLNPPLVEVWYLYNLLWVPDTAIRINADDVKLQGFTINSLRGDYGLGDGIHADGDKIEIANCRIASNGVYLRGSSITITDNSITKYLQVTGSKQTITNNSIQESLNIQGSYNKITGNRIKSLFNLNGSSNFISGNSFWMLEMIDSSSNSIIGNFFARLALVERGRFCSDNLIEKNQITSNGGYNSGIWVGSGSNNTVTENTIRDCDSGLTLTGAVTETSVYLNNFINNTVNIKYYGDYADWTLNNRFDNGVKGNYYDDYKGADNNGDGIGDVPYTIRGSRWDSEAGGVVSAGFAQDRYPLMAPFGFDSVILELPEWANTSPSPSPTPSPEPTITPTPYEEPQPSEQDITAGAILAVTSIVVFLGLLVYFIKRKKAL